MRKLDKKSKILAWVLIVWGAFFFIDMLCIHYLKDLPIFMLPFTGGEMRTYVGLGYVFRKYFSFTNGPAYSSFDVSVMPFVIIYTLVTAIFLFNIIWQRHRKKR